MLKPEICRYWDMSDESIAAADNVKDDLKSVRCSSCMQYGFMEVLDDYYRKEAFGITTFYMHLRCNAPTTKTGNPHAGMLSYKYVTCIRLSEDGGPRGEKTSYCTEATCQERKAARIGSFFRRDP